jgi:hypothetical protein
MQTMTGRDVRREFNRLWRDICRRDPRWLKDEPARRTEFSVFVDDLARSGRISERVAQNVTLD